MSSREDILGSIRQSLALGGLKEQGLTRDERLQLANKHISSHPRGIVPDTLSKTRRSPLAVFCEKALQSQASLKKVKSYARVGPAILDYLRQQNLPKQIRMGKERRLAKLIWGKNGAPEISIGASEGRDLVSLSHAMGAACETGTLFLGSGPDNPSTLNFLPETHIVVVNRKDIRKSYEGMWKMIRRKFGKGQMPRTINLITGPSRSADIEQTLILGAHGPLRLHIIVVDEGG